MTPAPEHTDLERLALRLAPYARKLVADGGACALGLHADEVGVEHLLCALMADEDCAAHRVVLHAFADPETIAEEARATAAGILVVGSRCTLSFSARGVRVLFAARALADGSGEGTVEPEHLLAGATAELPDEARAALSALGWQVAPAAPAVVTAASPGGSVFKPFDTDAKRALADAARAASEAREPHISPARIAVACLHVDEALALRTGLAWTRVRTVLRPYALDEAPLGARPLAPDGPLRQFLGELSDGADSVGLLAGYLGSGTPEQAALLTRNKITAALLERSQGVFLDP